MKNDMKPETKVRECFHCGNRAPMKVASTYTHKVVFGDPPYTDEDYYMWSILLCPSCHKPTLEEVYKSTFEQDMEGWPSHARILYPSLMTKTEELPGSVKKAYEAALKVRNVEPNAFAVLIGRTLETICQDRKANGRNLHERLKDLSNRDEIPTRLAEMAQGIRILRNIGAHADLGEIADEDIPILKDLCEAILEYIYRAPARLKILESRLDSLKKQDSENSPNNE